MYGVLYSVRVPVLVLYAGTRKGVLETKDEKTGTGERARELETARQPLIGRFIVDYLLLQYSYVQYMFEDL